MVYKGHHFDAFTQQTCIQTILSLHIKASSLCSCAESHRVACSFAVHGGGKSAIQVYLLPFKLGVRNIPETTFLQHDKSVGIRHHLGQGSLKYWNAVTSAKIPSGGETPAPERCHRWM